MTLSETIRQVRQTPDATRRFDRGCDPRRDTASTIERAGFSRVALRTLRTAGVFGGLAPIIEGEAIR